MSPSGRRATVFALFLVVTVVLTAADVWSKRWAEANLASPVHPIPIQVPEEGPQTLGELLAWRWPGLPDDEREAMAARTVLLETTPELHADTPVFGPDAPPVSGFYVFVHERLDRAPRRLWRREHRLVARWVRGALPEVAPDAVQRAVAQQLGTITLAEYIRTHVPFLDEAKAATVAEQWTFPFRRPFRRRLSAASAVHPGQVYLVTDRSIDVVEGLFRLIYAENPGAAWGLLRQMPSAFRKFFFLGTSVLAAIVVLLLAWRLQPGDELAAIAFGGVLAGAIGNSIDRIRYDFVVDFLDMYVGNAHWPTYNVADIGITVGVALVLVEVVVRKKGRLLGQQSAHDTAGRVPVDST